MQNSGLTGETYSNNFKILKMESNLNKPRLVPMDTEKMPEECKEILKRIPGDTLKGRYAPVNLLGTLMYNPETLKPFLDYWVTSKLKLGLSVREQELVILRMALHYRCNYVWKHHVPVAMEFGVSQEELALVCKLPLSAGFNTREEALLILTDHLVNDRDLAEEIYEKYGKKFKDSELVDLISLVSQYVLFTLMNNVLRVEVESTLDEVIGL
jgi:alkylhydroperoxidase family enzyme